MGIQHDTITPLHPQANGLVENFNRMINKVVRIASIERKCWKQELFKFLRNYRATPHTTTGKRPANLHTVPNQIVSSTLARAIVVKSQR